MTIQAIGPFLPSIYTAIIMIMTSVIFKVRWSIKNRKDILERMLVGCYMKKEEQPISKKKLTIPNFVYSSGFFFLLLYFFLEIPPEYSLALLTATITTDLIDGFLARSCNMCSRVGAWIDPLRDRALGLTIVFQMIQTDGSLYVHILGILIIAAELSTLFVNAANRNASVHTVGKTRMMIHSYCILIFVLQTHNIPLWEQLHSSIASLTTIMFFASLASFLVYGRVAFSELYKK